LSQCIKVDTLGRLCDDNLERSYNSFTTTIYILLELCIILISLIIYIPSTLIIFPQTFSMQLGAGTSLFCLSQYTISFCTLSMWLFPIFMITCPLTKSFLSKMMCLHCCFLLEYSSIFLYYTLDAAL